MPPALALLLLLGLGARGGGGCLQCEVTVVDALKQLRGALIPQRFHLQELRTRAQVLLLAMEGPFFRDYSLHAFVGKVGLDPLEQVVTFLRNETNTVQRSSLRGFSDMQVASPMRGEKEKGAKYQDLGTKKRESRPRLLLCWRRLWSWKSADKRISEVQCGIY
ncbi:izumo sperm-egg fusion protein 2 isoform X1 [Talpa occidentalis]|uniref:izumo sperm-egg fusion protein 2 isoform X1 n=1 Tax=Talpa occidentalis TaxID=50954 RepID=UPI0018909BDC|nr:izumo sperm-egg fusion protein 2 isoform X1 [Talpa occidentalis]